MTMEFLKEIVAKIKRMPLEVSRFRKLRSVLHDLITFGSRTIANEIKRSIRITTPGKDDCPKYASVFVFAKSTKGIHSINHLLRRKRFEDIAIIGKSLSENFVNLAYINNQFDNNKKKSIPRDRNSIIELSNLFVHHTYIRYLRDAKFIEKYSQEKDYSDQFSKMVKSFESFYGRNKREIAYSIGERFLILASGKYFKIKPRNKLIIENILEKYKNDCECVPDANDDNSVADFGEWWLDLSGEKLEDKIMSFNWAFIDIRSMILSSGIDLNYYLIYCFQNEYVHLDCRCESDYLEIDNRDRKIKNLFLSNSCRMNIFQLEFVIEIYLRTLVLLNNTFKNEFGEKHDVFKIKLNNIERIVKGILRE